MTRFTVVWLPQALNELSSIWLAAVDRAAVTTATSVIDRLLANDPESKGELADGENLVTRIPPLQVAFRVRPLDRIAEVVRVKLMPRHRK